MRDRDYMEGGQTVSNENLEPYSWLRQQCEHAPYRETGLRRMTVLPSRRFWMHVSFCLPFLITRQFKLVTYVP